MGRKSYNLGKIGENVAEKHLSTCGYQVIKRNHREKHGEIDLVAWEKGNLVFVEVKTYLYLSLFDPAYAVDINKQRRIIQSALRFITKNKLFHSQVRFDVLTITYLGEQALTNQKELCIELYKDAFRA
jgi:putative endonuclease